MKQFVSALLFSSVLVGSSVAYGGAQDFTLINRTGHEIDEVYITPNHSDDWEDDILGQDTLDSGESVKIHFGRDASTCVWDLRVVYTNGAAASWEGFDLCSLHTITVQ
ncbi:MAG: hypothetical protein G8345_09375 [Magnetococcales bacterium]|nr:hypothetical protein [Magnetococcales bacterium]NGZ27085.1 hypothetical protein [Magnetococcales bacterium]